MGDPRYYCDACHRSFHHHPEGMAMLGQCVACWQDEQMRRLYAELAEDQEALPQPQMEGPLDGGDAPRRKRQRCG